MTKILLLTTGEREYPNFPLGTPVSFRPRNRCILPMSKNLSYTTSLPLQLQALATVTTGQELVVHRTVLSVLYRVISHPFK
jgi:hypothetical protein